MSCENDDILHYLTLAYEKAQFELSREPRHTSAIFACNLTAMAIQQRKQYLMRSEEPTEALENFPIAWPKKIPKRNRD